jgi:hypothetical protein
MDQTTRPNRRFVAAAGFVFIAAAAALAITLASQGRVSSPVRGRVASLPVALKSDSQLSATLVSHYSTLRGPSTAAPYPLPRSVVNGWLGSPSFGLDPGQARYIHLPGLAAAWLIPGSGGACFVWLSPTGGNGPNAGRLMSRSGCGTVSDVDSQGLVSVQGTSNGEMLLGAVPDGTSVSVTKADGASIDVPVADNAFAISTTAGDRFTSYRVGMTTQQAPTGGTPPA